MFYYYHYIIIIINLFKNNIINFHYDISLMYYINNIIIRILN